MNLPRPDDIALHYDAQALAGLSDGDPVAQWDDLSGNGRHQTQSNLSLRPTYLASELNGLPVVRFGVQDYLLWQPPVDNNDLSRNNTIFVVMAHRGPNSGRAYGGSQVSIISHVFRYSSDGRWELFNGNAVTSSIAADSGWHVHAHVGEGDNAGIWIDGQQVASGNYGSRGTWRFALAADWNGNNGGDCDIAELIFYQARLDKPDIEAVEGYLTEKWMGDGPLPPHAPANLTAEPISSTRIDLDWDAPSEGPTPDSYTVRGQLWDGSDWGAWQTLAVGLTQTSYSHTDLQPRQTWQYQARAVADSLAGDWSDPAQATTLAALRVPMPLLQMRNVGM